MSPFRGRASDSRATQRHKGTSNSEDEMMESIDDLAEEIKIESARDKRKVYETVFDCLSTADVEKMVTKDADQLVNIFGVDVSDFGIEDLQGRG